MPFNTYPRITSIQNPRIKVVVQLQKKHERHRSGLMLIEGVRELSLAIIGNIAIKEIYICPDVIDSQEEKQLLHELQMMKIQLSVVSRKVFSKIAYRESSGGFVAVAERQKHSLDDLNPCENPLYLVVDAVEKPGNLGALLRSADAAGVDGIIVSEMKTDLSNPNVIRASIGTIFTVPSVIASPQETAKWLKSNKISVITATPHGDVTYTEADMTSPCAIVVGSEDLGISATWLEASHVNVRIPMLGKADSLNVSAAATILLYEALRQRRDKVVE